LRAFPASSDIVGCLRQRVQIESYKVGCYHDLSYGRQRLQTQAREVKWGCGSSQGRVPQGVWFSLRRYGNGSPVMAFLRRRAALRADWSVAGRRPCSQSWSPRWVLFHGRWMTALCTTATAVSSVPWAFLCPGIAGALSAVPPELGYSH